MAVVREDMSSKLIHLTRDTPERKGRESFLQIIEEAKLRGGNGFIKGGHKCVCFSEAPVSTLAKHLATPSIHGIRYAPFGIMVDKDWLFSQGGRPTIYQPMDEYESLPESQKFRHVTYDPQNGVDFTWEREWRIKTDELKLELTRTTAIVPTRKLVDDLLVEHMGEIEHAVSVLGETAACAVRPYQWHFIVLEDLGIPF